MRLVKNVAVLTEGGTYALFFRPYPGGFDNSRVPHCREFAIQGQKNANAWGPAGGGGGEVYIAGID